MARWTDGFLLPRPENPFLESFLSAEKLMRQPTSTKEFVKHTWSRVCVCTRAGTKKKMHRMELKQARNTLFKIIVIGERA